MSGIAAGRTLDWEGGTLDELLAVLAEPALSARVEVRPPTEDQVVGEVHVVAGGPGEITAGKLRGDAALAFLKTLAGARFRVEPRLPHPTEGGLAPPGPDQGTLEEQHVAALMRYCEDFVLTCAVELRRGMEVARINYRRGEITKTVVNGSESPERLPDVMGWQSGTWRIVLPQLVLPKPQKPSTIEMGTLWGYPAPQMGIPGAVNKGGPPAARQTSPAPQPEPAPGSGVPTPMAPMHTLPMVAAGPAGVPQPRTTIPFLPEPPASHRGTAPGLPVDVFDPPQPARTTDMGVPTLEPRGTPPRAAGPLRAQPIEQPARPAAPGPTTAPEIPIPAQRSTQPGYTPAQKPEPFLATRLGRPAPILPPPGKNAAPDLQTELMHAVQPPAPRRRSLFDLPLLVPVLLGLGLGLAVVAGYWLYLRMGPP